MCGEIFSSEKAKMRYEITVENSSPHYYSLRVYEREIREEYRRRVSRSVGEREREREVRE
jgi:hypothetical protein